MILLGSKRTRPLRETEASDLKIRDETVHRETWHCPRGSMSNFNGAGLALWEYTTYCGESYGVQAVLVAYSQNIQYHIYMILAVVGPTPVLLIAVYRIFNPYTHYPMPYTLTQHKLSLIHI